jgi:hypothetical protein
MRDADPDYLRSVLLDDSTDTITRLAAIESLVSSQTTIDEKIDVLHSCLHVSDRQVIGFAIYYLGYLKHKPSANALKEFIWSPFHNLQFHALQSLAQMGDESVYDPCVYLVSHGDHEQRTGALIALGRLGKEKANSILQIVLESNEDREMRILSAGLLAKHRVKIGEKFLENQISQSAGIEKIHIACRLASIDNKIGLSELRNIISEKRFEDQNELLFLKASIQDLYGIKTDMPEAEWKNATYAMIESKLTKRHE